TELGPEYTAEVLAEYQSRRDVLYDALRVLPGVFLRKPEGAFYFVARLPVKDAEDFAAWMLSDFCSDGVTVMVSPAAGFYATQGLGRDEVRIAYVLNRDDLALAVKALARGFSAYREARGLGPLASASAGAAAR